MTDILDVFNTIQMILNNLPVAVRLVGIASMGGIIYIAVLRSVRR